MEGMEMKRFDVLSGEEKWACMIWHVKKKTPRQAFLMAPLAS